MESPRNLFDPDMTTMTGDNSTNNSRNISAQDEVATPTDVKLAEARTAILLRNTNSYGNRNDPTMWILEHMFRPLTTRDYEEYQILLLSGSVKPLWERKRKDIRSQPQESSGYFTSTTTSQIVSPETAEGTPTPPVISSQFLPTMPVTADKMYIMTPRTRILTVAKEHAMAFMIDLSSSLATIETSTGKVMIGNAYNVLENIINGIVRPFSLNVSDTSPPIVMEHIIRITVIAECSQFGSNMNVIPILAEYPTMRVLMQNVFVSVNNVSTVLKTLKDLINAFKKDLGKFRKKLTMKRSKMGYELDVRDDHAQTVEESAESSFSASLESPTKTSSYRKGSVASIKGSAGGAAKTTVNGSLQQQQQYRHARNKSISKHQHAKKSSVAETSLMSAASSSSGTAAGKKSSSSHHHHHHYGNHRHSSSSTSTLSNNNNTTMAGSMRQSATAKDKKDVWGVGKTGSTLSYILRAGLFALNLLPKEGQHSLILITDGVVKSNISDESVIRQLTAEHVACSVVQIGQDRSFFPGLNFGFVPDNEILEFLTTATQGQFMFAENCPPIVLMNEEQQQQIFSDPPNVYHHRLLLKEVNLDKVNSTRKKKDNINTNNGGGGVGGAPTNDNENASSSSTGGGEQHHEHRVFPWDPYSQPIMEDIGICKYKEYFLPTECWHFMRARLRQGFLLYSVALIDEIKAGGIKTTTTNGVKYVGQQSDEDNISSSSNNFQKKESVIIVFVLHWQPNITVEYRIKSLWTSSLRHYLKSISHQQQDRLVNIPEEPHLFENDNIFSCMRAPRAQIVIKSTASFTHMLSNWDQFQRRNQMMAVQGAKSSIDVSGTPGFIKVGKMKRLLERLAETDGMLKQLVQFSYSSAEKILTISSSTGNSNKVDWTTHQLNYVQKFSSHWAKLERSELRVFNMCWYDEEQFNLIIGSSLTPYNMKNYHLDGNYTMGAEFNEIQGALNHIYAKLEHWATFMSEDQQVYIKVLNLGNAAAGLENPDTKYYPVDSSKRMSLLNEATSKKLTVPQFCELRVVRETDKVLCIKLMFFNVDSRYCHLITEDLQHVLNTQSQQQQQTLTSLEVKSPPNGGEFDSTIRLQQMQQQHQQDDTSIVVTLTKRPLSSLLMRDGVHFLPKATGFENGKLFTVSNTTQQQQVHLGNNKQQNTKSLWYINPALVLTGEFIVRNYLLQYTWHWDTRDIIPSEKHAYGRYFASLLNLAFEHITVTRLEQGWSLISFSKSFQHFYREIFCNDGATIYSVQYFIWKDLKRITTELWLEPLSDESSAFKSIDHVRADIFEKDKQILSQLVTFDIMYSFGQDHTMVVADALSDQMEVDDELRGTVKWMQRSSLFNLSSVLRFGSFLFASYPCPKYNRHFHPDGNDSVVVDHQQAAAAVSNSMSVPIMSDLQQQESGGAGYVRRRNATSANTLVASGTSRSRTVSKFSPIGSPFINAAKTSLIWHSDGKSNTTCTCPRPDELICDEKDNISQLPPVLRDIALLHYYIENSLSAVTDRSMSLNKTPLDEFWSSIVKELLQNDQVGASQSTLYVAQNFRDLRCFIKIFDPAVFVIVLVPRLDAVVKGLNNVNINSGSSENSFDRMGLMIFECHRQDSGGYLNRTLNFDQIRVRPIDPMSSQEWLESLKSTLRPDLSRGFLTNTISNITEPLSDRTLRLMQDVSQVYSRSFVKSIFTCLMHGRAIDSEDFEKVVEICDESNLDIDLTGYLNVQTLLKRRSRTNEDELISVNQRFISVLGHYFEPVIIFNSKWTNMYCYRPPFAKVGQKLGLSLSSGEKPSNLADVVVCAQNPLFVRLDCTLRKPNGVGGFEEITFPLRSLPASYEGEANDGNRYNYESESIGTEFSPVDSADGTSATLHLVCMTLPQSEYDPPNSPFSHKPACPVDSAVPHQTSFLDAHKTHRARLPSLSQDKQDALVETEARLTWLFTEEIMHGLLRSGPITQNVIQYIEDQLKKKNPFVDFPTTMFIPLAFVKNQKESRRMFFEELEKQNSSPYRLIRVGDCFYASDNGTSNSNQAPHHDLLEEEVDDDDGSLFDGEGLNITTDSSFKKRMDNSGGGEQGSDEFCEGLGISILEPETPEELDNSNIEEPSRPQLYWLLLIPQVQNVQIYFYSKMQQSVNQSEIIRVTKAMVNEVMERTNKMSLLQHLHDTRRCSKYLLAPHEDERLADSSDEDESSEDDDEFVSGSGNNLVEILSTSGEEATFTPPRKFTLGQFACDVVFTKRFPLHWRLQPNAAFNKLMVDTLPPFLVKNKPGMFVISHKSAVVYCFLSEVTTTIHSSTLSDSMTQSFLSTNNNEADDAYFMAHPDSPYGSSLVNVSSNDNNDVFGSSSHSRVRHASQAYNKQSPQGSINSERQQFSPRNSPSFTDAGVSASSPATGKRPGGRQYEGRELVLEVYGVESDEYIVDGLVDMIESRITSEITLKEVQQFLIRNPNSKLSREDIEFILPVEKEPLIHKQLCIPSLVENSVQFLKIFRKNVLNGSSLHAIHSNYLPVVIKKQHDLRYSSYGNSDLNSRLLGESGNKFISDEWSCLDLSFYYNYLNRAPGMYLPFEQKIGEGVAGICLSVINEDDLAYSRITSSYSSGDSNGFNLSDLATCLDSDFEQADTDNKLRVCIDIWSNCKIDVEQIYIYIHKSFRQSICDYIIENAVSFIPRQPLLDHHSNSNSNNKKNEFESIASLLLFALSKASEWGSSTVKQASRAINLTPWYFDGIVQQLKCDLLDIHPSLEPTIARAQLPSCIQDFCPGGSSTPIDFKLFAPGSTRYSDLQDTNKSKTSLQDSKKVKSTYGFNAKTPFTTMTSSTSTTKIEKKQIAEIPPFRNKNFRYLVIAGLPELHSKYVSFSSNNPRRSSTDVPETPSSRLSGRFTFGNGSTSVIDDEHNMNFKSDGLKRDDTGSLHSRQESLASSISKIFPSSYIPKQQKTSDSKDISHQHSFLIFTLDSSCLSMYSYNCSDNFTDHIFNTTFKNVAQQETRHLCLNNILHQKLGLFHHTDKMVDILSHGMEALVPIAALSVPQTISATPLQHNAITLIQNANNSNARAPMSPSVANTIGRLVQTDLSSSITTSIDGSNTNDRRNAKVPIITANSNSSKSFVVDFDSLRQLVINTFDCNNNRLKARSSSSLNLQRFNSIDATVSSFQHQQTTVLDTADNAKLGRLSNKGNSTTEIIYTAVRGADANTVLRDTYAESTQENKNQYKNDYLLRHGEPYLDMYLARSKPLAAYEKAFKVYTKWADHYYGPGHTKSVDEMMTVEELKQILKASRLLHFCRTPLIFSQATTVSVSDVSLLGGVNGREYENLFNKLNITKSEVMTAWYERLSRGFMREYASYLESIGMHLIVYGPSNNQEDEVKAYLSQFSITEDYSVDSPVVYLLQVFEGGTIMCEVRLTGAFVSVTLYTLHRRYGRLQNSPFAPSRKEIGRESFQNFMGECDLFKQRIHVNSFVFDFHLRYIQRSLDDVELLPSNLNLLSIIKNMVSVYDRPAIYSRNRIINGVYEFLIEDSLSGLPTWILGSGSKLKLKTLTVDKVPVACFVSSKNLSFEHKGGLQHENNEDAPFRYTLIICPVENSHYNRCGDSFNGYKQGSFDMIGSQPGQKLVSTIVASGNGNEYSRKISLQYYILVTYRDMDRCHSSDRCQRAWSQVLNDKPRRYADLMDEVLIPDSIKMKDVFDSCKSKIDQIIKKAIQFFHREADWNKLYEIVQLNLTKQHLVPEEDLVLLTSRFNPINLGDADPAFNKFLQLKGLNWHDVLDNLKPFYKMTLGEIYIRDTRHVLLFISNAASPTFFYFVCAPGGQGCKATINTKELRKEGHVLREDEKLYISHLATNLSYLIWKRVRDY